MNDERFAGWVEGEFEVTLQIRRIGDSWIAQVKDEPAFGESESIDKALGNALRSMALIWLEDDEDDDKPKVQGAAIPGDPQRVNCDESLRKRPL